MQEIRKSAYLLPWKNNDTPQCFLEVTRKCNIRCPSCYQRDGFLGEQHKPLARIIKEIDILDATVNPSAVCIIGGEPLEHPALIDIVKYVKIKKLTPVLFSNVFKLDEQNLAGLVAAGLEVIYAHIDQETGHHLGNNLGETDMMKYRERFASLLRKYTPKIYGMINAIISDANIAYLPAIQGWAYQNSDIIKYCVFTLNAHKAGEGQKKEIPDILEILRKSFPGFRINSYLKGTVSETIHWAQSVAFIDSRKRIKYASRRTLRTLNSACKMIFGRYVSILSAPLMNFIPGFFTTVLVRPHSRGTIDFCGGCPDQTVIWVKRNANTIPLVVHSCLSQDFLSKGYSEEEDALVKHVSRHPAKKDVSICDCTCSYYSKDLEVVSHFDI